MSNCLLNKILIYFLIFSSEQLENMNWILELIPMYFCVQTGETFTCKQENAQLTLLIFQMIGGRIQKEDSFK